MGAHYDLARFGSERLSFSPRQADLLMVMGTIAKRWDPSSARFTNKWPNHVGCSPWVLAPAPAVYSTLTVYLQGIDRIIPVDVYVPGCPPRPEQIIDGVMKIQKTGGNRVASQTRFTGIQSYAQQVRNRIMKMADSQEEKLVSIIKEKFEDQVVLVEQLYDFLTITLKKDKIVEIIRFLYDHPETKFQFLTTIAAIHSFIHETTVSKHHKINRTG